MGQQQKTHKHAPTAMVEQDIFHKKDMMGNNISLRSTLNNNRQSKKSTRVKAMHPVGGAAIPVLSST